MSTNPDSTDPNNDDDRGTDPETVTAAQELATAVYPEALQQTVGVYTDAVGADPPDWEGLWTFADEQGVAELESVVDAIGTDAAGRGLSETARDVAATVAASAVVGDASPEYIDTDAADDDVVDAEGLREALREAAAVALGGDDEGNGRGGSSGAGGVAPSANVSGERHGNADSAGGRKDAQDAAGSTPRTAGTLADFKHQTEGREQSYGRPLLDHDTGQEREQAQTGMDFSPLNAAPADGGLCANDEEDEAVGPATAGTLSNYRTQQSEQDGRGDDTGSLDGQDKGLGLSTNSGDGFGDSGPATSGTLAGYRANANDDDTPRVGVFVDSDGKVWSGNQQNKSEKPPTHLKRDGYRKERGSRGYMLRARSLRRAGRWGSWGIPGEDELND